MNSGPWFLRFLFLLGPCLGAAGARGADLSDAQLRDGLTKLAAFMAGDVPRDARWVLVQSQGRLSLIHI